MSVVLEESFVVVQPAQQDGPAPSFRGTIVNVNDETIVVCFESPLGLAPNEPITIGYKDPGTRRFVRAPGTVRAYLTHDPKPVYELTITGQFQHSEQRHDFRVSTHGLDLTAKLGDERGCNVLDLSTGGLAVVSRSERRIGERLTITLQYGKQTCSGTVIIRHLHQISAQRTRCGLQIDSGDRTLRSFAHALSMQIQREQLRRRSRVLADSRERAETGEESKVESNAVASESKKESACTGLAAVIPFDLLIGRPLPGTLRSMDGRVLRQKGETITADDVAQFRRVQVLLGSDWWDNGGKCEPVFRPGLSDRREYDRLEWKVEATIEVHEPHDVRRLKVVTRDLSQGGMSFYSRSYIAIGTRLTMEIPINNRIYKVRGCVVSCDYETRFKTPTHCVGVELTESILESNQIREAG